MKPYVRLSRTVMRGVSQCHSCGYPIVEYDEIYRPTVDGKALFEACSARCASMHVTAPLVVAYL